MTLENSVKDVQRVGVPVYSMLYGGALSDSTLNERLTRIAKSTGGIPYKLRKIEDLSNVLTRIGEDLQHIYMLGYQSENVSTEGWRSIKVTLPAHPRLQLRAKQGYWR